MDENIYRGQSSAWKETDIMEAVKILLSEENNSNFDTIIKNLENIKELYDFILRLIINSEEIEYVSQVPIINMAKMNGMIKNENKKVRIHNKIYEEYMTDYYVGKEKLSGKIKIDVVQSTYLKSDSRLDMKKVMLKFQELIKEKYSNSDLLKSDEFLENDLRMLFLTYMKPIINGVGFSFKEVQTSAEKRLDMVVIFRDEKFIIEMKVWRGAEYHIQGIEQLKGYMKREGVKEGYMLIMDKRRNKEFMNYEEEGITMVWI